MNLSTSYLGLDLRSPLIVGASPLGDDALVARKYQDAGAGALVMRSLFEEQLAARDGVTAGGGLAHAFLDYADYQFSPEQYLRQLERLKHSLSIPVIASLNGYGSGAWVDFAARLERAGADAVELNFYQVVTDPALAADRIETEMLETVGEVAGALRIPVAVKLSPFHESVAQLVIALELAGAAGVVIFNRFYQPDVDPVSLEVRPSVHLSEPEELLLRLRWLAILSPQVRCSLAASGGVHSPGDAAKALLTGAHAVQLVSVLLQHGPSMLAALENGLKAWMREHGFTDLGQFRGRLNLGRCPDPAEFERAGYIRSLQSWKG